MVDFFVVQAKKVR